MPTAYANLPISRRNTYYIFIYFGSDKGVKIWKRGLVYFFSTPKAENYAENHILMYIYSIKPPNPINPGLDESFTRKTCRVAK
jgi:hypothetical protein